MLRNALCIFASAAQRPAASAALFSLWLAWVPGNELANDRELASNLSPFVDNGEAPSRAGVVRAKRADGGESLYGTTRLQLRGAMRAILVEESARIATDGRLLRAEVQLRYIARANAPLPKGLTAQAIFDAGAGLVSVVDREGATRVRRVAMGAPWFYVPVSLPSGSEFGTPVAAIVAQAAARAAPAVLRVSALGSELSVSADQLWVVGTNEGWVLLGDDLATFSCTSLGCDELLKLHVAALGIDLEPTSALNASM